MVDVRYHLRRLWRDFLSVYYANTPTWRWLKAGTLLLFGLFCWSAAGLLYSYRPTWGFLTYGMAYGFVLVLWGPLTHLVVLPLVIRARRRGVDPRLRPILDRASRINLTVFLGIVVLLGTVAPGTMMLDFSGAWTGSAGGADVDAELVCETAGTLVSCEVRTSSSRVSHVTVVTGERTIRVINRRPYAFEVSLDELEESVGGHDLEVILRDEEGRTLRRFARSL